MSPSGSSAADAGRFCPLDGSPLVEQELARGVPVPVCATCSAHWFAHGRLHRYAKERRRELRLDPKLRGVALEPGEPALACPECGTLSLATHRYRADRLHSCGRCHGLLVPAGLLPWLDAPRTPHDPVELYDDDLRFGRNPFPRLLWRAARFVFEWALALIRK